MENNNPLDLDVLAGKIQLIVQRIKSDSNPEELDQLKKLYKKNVPFSLRGYFTAYLLRESERAGRRPEKKKQERREERSFEKKAREREPQQQKQKAERKSENPAPKSNGGENKGEERKQPRVIPEGAKTLYVNLGKIGRVYARDLIDLIMNSTDITKDEIYAVRVHDKYSFVTLSEENCNKAIEALLGKDHNGRTIQINISNREAKKNGAPAAKAEEAPAAAEASPAEEEEKSE